MNIDLPFIAGTISTVVFALSTLPMLIKAYRTQDLRSYSLGNIGLANGGNLVHSLYVYSLPPGPIWFLHGFYLITTGMMLFWYLRYERGLRGSGQNAQDASAEALVAMDAASVPSS